MPAASSLAPNHLRLAVIDHDERFRSGLADLLEEQGHQATRFSNTEGLLDASRQFDCLLLGLWFKNGHNGLDFLRRLSEGGGMKPTVMMVSQDDADAAFQAAKLGAAACITKPKPSALQIREALRQANARSCQPTCPPVTMEDLLRHGRTLNPLRWNCLLCRNEKRLSPELFSRLQTLSPVETTLFLLLTSEAKPTKCLAEKMGIGVRTAETHRGRVFDKLHLRTVMELRQVLEKLLRDS